MRNLSNVSSLFSSMSNSSSGSNSLYGFSLTDYSMIKSGSYGKLMKAYYNKDSKLSKMDDNSSATSSVNKLSESVDKTGLTKLKAEADGLKSSANKLSEDSMWSADTDKTKITDAVKDFATKYNDVIEQSSKVSSTSVDNSAKWMKSLTSTMSNALSKVGVNVGTDGKLSVDEEALGKADVNSIKSLFKGDYSYGGQVSTKAQAIDSAVSSLGTYNSGATYNNSLMSMFNVGV